MAWQHVEMKRGRGRPSRDTARIDGLEGRIIITESALRRHGLDAGHFAIFIDPENRRVGLRPSPSYVAGTFKGGLSSRRVQIYCKKVIRRFTPLGRSFTSPFTIEDGMIVIDLTRQERVTEA